MKYQLETIEDAAVWNDFVTSHPESNFLHSWQWGEFHIARKRTVLRRGIFDGDSLIGVYVGHVESGRRGFHMQIVGGPIIDWANKTAVMSLFDDIRAQATTHNCIYVRIRPQLEKSATAEKQFKNLGLRPAPMYLSVELAGVLDITQSDDEIQKNMRQRLRRSLRKAEKNNITIETTTDPTSMKEFYAIQLQTAGRHGFVPFTEEFLTKQFAAFAETGNAVLYIARHQGEVLAQNFMLFYGNEASYHYGVSTELGTQLSGAPLLHMQAIKDARQRGIGRYNFWGIVDEDDTKHRYYGVSVFKRGFGVEELRYLHAHDMVIKRPAYTAIKAIDMIRRRLRHV